MKEPSSTSQPQGKWAIEAFDFLRLFRRVGRSFIGLLFLEIGWTAYVLLLDKIIGKPNPATTSFPFPFWPALDGRLTVTLTSNKLLVVGSLLIAVAWAMYSGFHQYLMALLWWIVKPIVFVIFTVLGFILLVLNVLLLPVTWPVELRRISRWKAQNPQNLLKWKRASIREVRAGQNNWRDYKPKIRKSITDNIKQKIGSDRWVVMTMFGPVIGGLFTRMFSFGAIGFAPLASYSYEEDLQAAKAPVQIFAWAISKVRIQLRGLEALDWIRFKFLPVHFLVSTPQKAEFIRALFKLDVLLWGSYSTTEPGTIWLNIQQRLRPKTSDNGTSNRRTPNVDLFPSLLELDAPAVALSQDDPAEAHTLLLLVIVLILQNRWHTKSESRSKDFDRLYWLHQKVPEITNRLVYDAFLSITEKRLTQDFLPPTNVVLTTIIGQWLGHQLNQRASSVAPSRSIETLYLIARRCTELVPDCPEHFYRLGAYKCLRNDKLGALESFRKAAVLESKGQEVDPIPDQVEFESSLDEASREWGLKRRFALAKAVAHAARALNNQNDYTIGSLSKELAGHDIMILDEDSSEVRLIKEMLEFERKKAARSAS